MIDWLTYAGHDTKFIVGYGSEVNDALYVNINPEPEVMLKVVEPFVVDRTPP